MSDRARRAALCAELREKLPDGWTPIAYDDGSLEAVHRDGRRAGGQQASVDDFVTWVKAIPPLTPAWGGLWRDRLTGFQGEASARTEYLNGDAKLCLVRLDSYGKPEDVWLEEGRLERVESGKAIPGFGA